MRIKDYVYIFAIVLSFVACEDNESFSMSKSDVLTFSLDTVKLDTVFSNVPTATRSFWVYNHSSYGIRCNTIKLERGNQVGYRVNVDGTYLGSSNGYLVRDVEIRKGDSIRVFVELTSALQHQASPVKVEDNVIFELESGIVQKVPLKAYSWDAVMVHNLQVNRDTTIYSPQPLIIYDGITVAENATLNIAAGTTLYFHNDAGIHVKGKLRTCGTPSSPVVLRGERIDRMFDYLPYDNLPGQWQGINISQSSYGNIINFTDIHGAYNGIVADSADFSITKLEIANSIVHNCQGFGIKLNKVKAIISNSQVTNVLYDCLYVDGGNVEVNNCTMAQFYPFDVGRGVALRIINPLFGLFFRNTLITGYSDNEMVIDKKDENSFMFEDCVIRTPKVMTDDSLRFVRVIYENLKDTVGCGKYQFRKFDTDNFRYDFAPDSTSIIIGKANPHTATKTDKNGIPRDEKPDIGAYEYVKP